MSLTTLFSRLKGGAGSGNIGHAGRIGHRGGSAPKISGMSLSGLKLDPYTDWDKAQKVGNVYIVNTGKRLYSALIRDGKVLAQTQSWLQEKKGKKAYTMSGSEALEQKKGLGTELYMAVMKYAYPIPIKAEFEQTDAARGLHASLKRRPDVEDLGDGRLLYDPHLL